MHSGHAPVALLANCKHDSEGEFSVQGTEYSRWMVEEGGERKKGGWGSGRGRGGGGLEAGGEGAMPVQLGECLFAEHTSDSSTNYDSFLN